MDNLVIVLLGFLLGHGCGFAQVGWTLARTMRKIRRRLLYCLLCKGQQSAAYIKGQCFWQGANRRPGRRFTVETLGMPAGAR